MIARMARLTRAIYFFSMDKDGNGTIMISRIVAIVFLLTACLPPATASEKPSTSGDLTARLADEVRDRGWIAFSARSGNGTWDVFLSRPDGSQRRNITNTPDSEEAAPLFSQDGEKVLYRRLPKGTTIDHDLWGFLGQLVVANADGTGSVAVGEDRQYAWASWSPDAKQVLCLTRKEIQLVDIVTKKIVRTLPRGGIYQQLFWSPDGKWFTGTANHAGAMWCVVRMNADTGELNPISKFQSCTPDWAPDSKRIIYSCRPSGQPANDGYGWTQLYLADGGGEETQLLYGEDGYHIYGGTLSPDGKYALFTKCPKDGGGPEESGAPLCLMRVSDAPTIGGESHDLRKVHPETNDGPLLQLLPGWEPCWTYAELGVGK